MIKHFKLIIEKHLISKQYRPILESVNYLILCLIHKILVNILKNFHDKVNWLT